MRGSPRLRYNRVMPDDGAAPSETSDGIKPLDPRLRGVAMAVLVVALLAAVVFGANMRVRQAKFSELERMTDAMSEALEPSVLSQSPEKLQRILVDMAKAGELQEVSIADNSGTIIATTNSARVGTKSDAMKNATGSAKAESRNGSVVVRRAVILAGDTRFGNLEIRVAE